jgi:hypothetical protein
MDRDGEAERAAALFQKLPQLVDADARLIWRGRFLSIEIFVGIAAIPFHLAIAEGRVASLQRGPLLMRPWAFAIRANASAWLQYWQPVPQPGWHDLSALAKRGEATIEGDIRPFMANLQYIKDLMAAPRRPKAEA